MDQPLVHFVCGALGAGKTTYAMDLADRSRGVRYSIDEWMATLFAPDMPQALDLDWMWARVDRCETLIAMTAMSVARTGAPVVLDLGFTRRAPRQAMAARFRASGLAVQLHWLDVAVDERWRRVSHRNSAKGETYAFEVTKAMFDFMEARFEAPTPEEVQAFDRLIVTQT